MAGRYQQAFIVVTFSGGPAGLISPNDELDLHQLNTYFAKGGIPLGLIALDPSQDQLTVVTSVYPEHDEWEQADEVMDRLVEIFLENLGSWTTTEAAIA